MSLDTIDFKILTEIRDLLKALVKHRNIIQIKKDEYRQGIKIFYHKVGCDGDSVLTKMGFSDKFIIYCPKCAKQEIVE